MGLNESLGQARSQILLMSPMPSVNQAYAMVVNDECQKLTSCRTTGSISNSGVETLGMYSRIGGSTTYKGSTSLKRIMELCVNSADVKDTSRISSIN